MGRECCEEEVCHIPSRDPPFSLCWWRRKRVGMIEGFIDLNRCWLLLVETPSTGRSPKVFHRFALCSSTSPHILYTCEDASLPLQALHNIFQKNAPIYSACSDNMASTLLSHVHNQDFHSSCMQIEPHKK